MRHVARANHPSGGSVRLFFTRKSCLPVVGAELVRARLDKLAVPQELHFERARVGALAVLVVAIVAFATATELRLRQPPDALELVLLVVDDPGGSGAPRVRRHARYLRRGPGLGFEEAHGVLACLAGLVVGGRRLRRLRWPSSFSGGTSHELARS